MNQNKTSTKVSKWAKHDLHYIPACFASRGGECCYSEDSYYLAVTKSHLWNKLYVQKKDCIFFMRCNEKGLSLSLIFSNELFESKWSENLKNTLRSPDC